MASLAILLGFVGLFKTRILRSWAAHWHFGEVGAVW
jgi:hypothetical protein